MVSSYYFRNATRHETNTKDNYDFGHTKWIIGLETRDDREIIEIFKSMIELNKWLETDKIKAEADGYPIYIYQHGQLTCLRTRVDIMRYQFGGIALPELIPHDGNVTYIPIGNEPESSDSEDDFL